MSKPPNSLPTVLESEASDADDMSDAPTPPVSPRPAGPAPVAGVAEGDDEDSQQGSEQQPPAVSEVRDAVAVLRAAVDFEPSNDPEVPPPRPPTPLPSFYVAPATAGGGPAKRFKTKKLKTKLTTRLLAPAPASPGCPRLCLLAAAGVGHCHRRRTARRGPAGRARCHAGWWTGVGRGRCGEAPFPPIPPRDRCRAFSNAHGLDPGLPHLPRNPSTCQTPVPCLRNWGVHRCGVLSDTSAVSSEDTVLVSDSTVRQCTVGCAVGARHMDVSSTKNQLRWWGV